MAVLRPSFVTFAAISQQFLVVVEIMGKALRGGFVEFTPVIVIFPADGRTVLVNTAGTVLLDMLATSCYQQIPAAVVFVYFHIGM